MLFLHVAPSLSLQKLLSTDYRRSGAGTGLWISVSPPHSSHLPAPLLLLTSKISKLFFPRTWPLFWFLSREQQDPIIRYNTTTSCAFFTHSFTNTQWKFPKATWNVMSRPWRIVGVLVYSVLHTSLCFNFKYRVVSVDIGIFLTIFKSFK